jgi:hypothetical protein
MAGLNRLSAAPPTIVDAARERLAAMDQTSIIGGPVGRTVAGGFGGSTPIIARGGKVPPADLYGLHQEEILRQPVVGGSLSRALIGQSPVADSPLLHLAWNNSPWRRRSHQRESPARTQ